MARADLDADPAPVEHRQRVLQPHAELPDDLRAGQLLRVLVLRQVLIPQAAAIIGDVPGASGILVDCRLGCLRQRLLVQGIRDELAYGERHGPMLENLLDVQVEGLLGALWDDSPGIPRRRRPRVPSPVWAAGAGVSPRAGEFSCPRRPCYRR